MYIQLLFVYIFNLSNSSYKSYTIIINLVSKISPMNNLTHRGKKGRGFKEPLNCQ